MSALRSPALVATRCGANWDRIVPCYWLASQQRRGGLSASRHHRGAAATAPWRPAWRMPFLLPCLKRRDLGPEAAHRPCRQHRPPRPWACVCGGHLGRGCLPQEGVPPSSVAMCTRSVENRQPTSQESNGTFTRAWDTMNISAHAATLAAGLRGTCKGDSPSGFAVRTFNHVGAKHGFWISKLMKANR